MTLWRSPSLHAEGGPWEQADGICARPGALEPASKGEGTSVAPAALFSFKACSSAAPVALLS